MRGVLASSMTPEQLVATSDAAAVTPEAFPPLRDFTADGVVSDGCWTAVQPLAVTGVTLRRITGTYKKATGSGADPHLIYVNGWSLSDTQDVAE